ncbi:MAG: hypothetical protein ACSHWW_13735 [Nonlabens sp.]|uniref:hypothetical protein n=1 Tax=Nonlabens sp. TaxID=1888209 RepID=UPI003EF2D12D
MKTVHLICVTFLMISLNGFSQKIIENYAPLKNDSIRIGTGDNDFMPLIQKGYTLMLPADKTIEGVLIFLEDSGFDQKNKSSKQIYNQASEKGFAVLSVSTEIPFDFFFSNASMLSTHKLIQEVFSKHNLPKENIFFLGASLVGHRAMQYIKFKNDANDDFRLNIKGIVICNFTLDWTRKWYQHTREIRINRNDLWEAKFINYMLEAHLYGTPKTSPERYHSFSPYSHFDEKNENIKVYKKYAIRAYIEPAIKYRLTKYLRTLYENNSTDFVGFLAELKLAGNENADLIVLQTEDNPSQKRNTQTTWNEIDKDELIDWIQKQAK